MSETIEVKLFELRDKGTFIPLMCVKVPGGRRMTGYDRECWLVRRAGWVESGGVYVIHMTSTQRCHYDAFEWGDRTFFNAHQFIEKNWNELPNGALIDVRHILGETDSPCETEM
jgi:hypothetical protein